MPFRPWAESAQDPEPEHPVTPTTTSCNVGAGYANPDAEDPAAQSKEVDELAPKKKRPQSMF